MITRRELIQASVLASLLPTHSNAAILLEQTPPPFFYKVIFDRRFPASIELANKLQAAGESIYGITGDITEIWFHDLYHRWKQGPAPIAGMTAPGALFCLERLAWDHGLRVLSRAYYPSADDSSALVTWVIGARFGYQRKS
ncbi:MAG: hypothetical protein JOZ22_16100 [Acidobacteriia bacterium]|nr:hypothetical protein [Terriglobia bacterium]